LIVTNLITPRALFSHILVYLVRLEIALFDPPTPKTVPRTGALKMTDMKIQDVKMQVMKVQDKNTVLTEITLRYNEVCSFWLLLFS